ncbi:MAG: ketoacyl-ACP synthase III [Saprospiraceae bacterium]|nr:ketoacyl-ACP synthase III [Saprospiraceae bacterium]MBK7789212.1 ketoacyl-ACP synthase III [Saprospiraceae bacterium]MBK8112568.1 ketoacyl-ACP synthase III [Saprospiraceae bacterium]MBK8852168.1 ketoacyl-ACP synthase III [Saprospiraceae bacterium]MBL0083140.1 ketoacyl-ACP synthase III [Saprospiraceae bacterium]
MTKMRAAITGVAGYVPEDILTNDDLAKMVDTSDEWITTRTGIKQRHILRTPGKATSDMGYEIVTRLLEKTGTQPEEIELLICATVTGDMKFPDTANTILEKVGARNAFGFDINAACSGFLYALTTASKFIETGTYKKVIVVGVDMMSSIVDYTDRTTCVIFGDGGGGVLLEPNEEDLGVMDSILKADGAGRQYLHLKAGGSLMQTSEETVKQRLHYAYQDGKPVFKAAVTGMTSTIREVMERNNLDNDKIDWLVPHQANMRIINSVSEMLDFPIEKVMINIQYYGNTTAGTLPLCLADYETKLKKGDNVILTAFGGGFTWGTVYLKWAYDSKA